MAEEGRPRVHPDCINASNPYHECSQYCLQIIAETKKEATKSNAGCFLGMNTLKKWRIGKDKLAARLSVGSDAPIRFCPQWNVKKDDTITNRVTAIELMSQLMLPRDEAAAIEAPFEALADNGYYLLAQQLFNHRALVEKVNNGARRVKELSEEISQGDVRIQHLESEVKELHRRLASVEQEKKELLKEIESIKSSVADAAEEAQIDCYLEGFDDCKQMACTFFPSMDFGCIVPCPRLILAPMIRR